MRISQDWSDYWSIGRDWSDWSKRKDPGNDEVPVLVHCDGTGKGVDIVTALLVMVDRLSVDEAIERVTQKFPYISLRPTSRRQLHEMLREVCYTSTSEHPNRITITNEGTS
jgi:hypothetical protein